MRRFLFVFFAVVLSGSARAENDCVIGAKEASIVRAVELSTGWKFVAKKCEPMSKGGSKCEYETDYNVRDVHQHLGVTKTKECVIEISVATFENYKNGGTVGPEKAAAAIASAAKEAKISDADIAGMADALSTLPKRVDKIFNEVARLDASLSDTMLYISISDVSLPSLSSAKVDAADLSVETNRWNGRAIETKLSCFAAGYADIRCIGRNVRVDFSKVSGLKGDGYIYKNCGTLAKSRKPACDIAIKFVYEKYGKSKLDDGTFQTLVKAKNDAGFSVAQP